MIICVCHRVSDRDIARVVREGCASFDELQFELSVATGCGACHDCAQATFHEHRAAAAGGPAAMALGPALAPTAASPTGAGLRRRVIPVHALRVLQNAGSAA